MLKQLSEYASASVAMLIHHRELAWEMAIRELEAVYRGSMLGIGWLVVKPLLQAATPIVIVSTIWHTAGGKALPQLELAGFIIAGMIPWQIMSRSFEESTALVRDRADIVKQIKFPLEILPSLSLLTSFVGTAVFLLLWLLIAWLTGKASWTCLLLPIPMILLQLLILGAAWVLMIVGVVLKDIRNVVGLAMSLSGYLSPVILKKDMVSAKVWFAIQMNPLSHVVIAFRDVLYGECHPTSWFVFFFTALFCWIIGSWILNVSRLWINDVI